MFEDENLYIDTSFAEKTRPSYGSFFINEHSYVVTDENISMFTHINEL